MLRLTHSFIRKDIHKHNQDSESKYRSTLMENPITRLNALNKCYEEKSR